MNRVILMGNVGGDPELKTIPNGTAVVKFSLATSRKWKDRDGNRQEETEWHNIEAWGKVGEVIAQYVTKGQKLLVEGRIKTDKWEDQSGAKKYFTKVVLENFHFAGGGRDSNNQGGGNQRSTDPTPSDDDLPF